MRFSTKGRFAVAAMMEVALRERSGPVSLGGIGERQKMSLSYLEQLFSRLRQHGLVESTRGPGGGYTLRHRPEEITVADIVMAVDSEDSDADTSGAVASRQVSDNLTGELWLNLNAKMMEYLDGITLRSLMDEQRARDGFEEYETVKSPFTGKISTSTSHRLTAPNSVFAFGRSFSATS